MAAALRGRPAPAFGPWGSPKYWAPCLGVALVAMFLFYVTLQGLVQESAARAPVQARVTPASVQRPLARDREEAVWPVARLAALPVAPHVAPLVPLARAPAEAPRAATPVALEVTKCVGPSGEAEYSDGPCSEGTRATTLHLQ
ncbi:hypothetical protein ASC92_11050 [Variovorax sp. Root411]|nr:hypothetical protein ASC92_11050 [Variovorax sp. Root411]